MCYRITKRCSRCGCVYYTCIVVTCSAYGTKGHSVTVGEVSVGLDCPKHPRNQHQYAHQSECSSAESTAHDCKTRFNYIKTNIPKSLNRKSLISLYHKTLDDDHEIPSAGAFSRPSHAAGVEYGSRRGSVDEFELTGIGGCFQSSSSSSEPRNASNFSTLNGLLNPNNARSGGNRTDASPPMPGGSDSALNSPDHGVAPRHPRRYRPCYLLISLGLLSIIGSLAPALWRAMARKDVSGAFTLAQYILAVGIFVVGSMVAIHSRNCVCWQ